MSTDKNKSGEPASKYPLRIQVRPLLVPGTMGGGPNSIFIFISTGLDRQEAIVTLWHEILHVLHCAGGQEHDEEAIEALAQRLATACPDVLKICGLESRFADNGSSTPIRANSCPFVVEKPAAGDLGGAAAPPYRKES